MQTSTRDGRSQVSAETDPTIGGRVRAARERLGWTREELAYRAGISWSAIAQTESGRRTNLRPPTLSALAGALGVSIDYLIHGGAGATPMFDHHALLFRTDDELVEVLGGFLSEGVARSEAPLVVTTTPNVKLLRRSLGPAADHVEFFDAAGWYESPRKALVAYREYAEAKLRAGALWVRIAGEPIWANRSAAELRLWTRYESLLNLAFASWPVSLRCLYDERSVRPKLLEQVHVTHPRVVADGALARSTDYAEPEGFVLER
jgi:transcriptional regulator with XRE-family HTH domain